MEIKDTASDGTGTYKHAALRALHSDSLRNYNFLHREFRFPKRAGMPLPLAEMVQALKVVSPIPDSIKANYYFPLVEDEVG
jgi:hypothetical protein